KDIGMLENDCAAFKKCLVYGGYSFAIKFIVDDDGRQKQLPAVRWWVGGVEME
ncbi:7204_t:CDS:1, partial [Paraglomus occultum]